MILGVSTGALNENDINKSVKIIDTLGVDGIEIMFLFEKAFGKQKITQKTIDTIKGFKFRTIHGPSLYDYRGQEKILKGLFDFYKKIDANHIVFHAVELDLLKPVLEFNWNVCIENLMAKSKFTPERIKKILGKNVGLVVDVSHSLENSPERLSTLIKMFKNQIKEIHLSYINKEVVQLHQPLHLWKHELKDIEMIKKLNCPFMIETSYVFGGTIKKEVEFVKKWIRTR